MPDDLPGPLPRLAALSVDCADPVALAAFQTMVPSDLPQA
jgi:hypothetical protein